MDTLEYNGFIGTVDHSKDDEVFFGKIKGTNSLVNYEGTTMAELEKAFHEAVDNYVVYCKKYGLRASTPPLKTL